MPLLLSTAAVLAGAEVLLNLSASNITIGKAGTWRLLRTGQSAREIAAYAYSAAGPGESTTDLVWDNHAAIFECGERLTETERLPLDSILIFADVDLGRIRQERKRTNTFSHCRQAEVTRCGPPYSAIEPSALDPMRQPNKWASSRLSQNRLCCESFEATGRDERRLVTGIMWPEWWRASKAATTASTQHAHRCAILAIAWSMKGASNTQPGLWPTGLDAGQRPRRSKRLCPIH